MPLYAAKTHKERVALGKGKHGGRHDTNSAQGQANVQVNMRVLHAAHSDKDEAEDEERGANADGKQRVWAAEVKGVSPMSALFPSRQRPNSLGNSAVVHGQTRLLAVHLMASARVHPGELLPAGGDVVGRMGVRLEAELLRKCAAHCGRVWGEVEVGGTEGMGRSGSKEGGEMWMEGKE